MKYIKKYKIFESFDYESIIEDLKDMSLEVQDLGMKVNVWSERASTTIINSPCTESYIDAVQINIKKEKAPYKSDIKDFIERAISYMKDWEYTVFGSGRFKLYDLNDLDLEKVDLYDIYIRFYKPNDTYHVISHRPSHWNLIKCDFEDYDSANDWVNKNRSILSAGSKIISDKTYWKAVGKTSYFG
jgi:hypothetical protein